MKAKLPILTTLRLALQGKTVTKILTVFLCAFSFALFALASTGYLYDKKDVYTRAVVNYAQETSGAAQIAYQPTSAMSGPMGQDAIARFEETGLSRPLSRDVCILSVRLCAVSRRTDEEGTGGYGKRRGGARAEGGIFSARSE